MIRRRNFKKRLKNTEKKNKTYKHMGQKRPKGIFEICSEEGKQQITFNSIEEFDDLVSALEKARAHYIEELGEEDADETEHGVEETYLSSYCLLNADGIVMAKIIADKYDQDEAGKFHLFYEKDKIVAVAPASWTVVREANFDEES